MVNDVLKALHKGHAGVGRCLAAAKQTVFWPTMTKDITREVEKCKLCAKFSNKKRITAPTLDSFETSMAVL